MRSNMIRLWGGIIIAVMIGAVTLRTAHVAASPAIVQTTTLQPASVVQGVTGLLRISYQGRLLDAVSGQSKPDGVYTLAFRLYAVESGGAALWAESKSVTVNKGLFSTLLGDVTPLELATFNGQDLFLGITVGSDPEAAPRQRVAHVAYAIFAANADTLDGKDGTAFAPAVHTHAGDAITDNSLTAADIAEDAVTNVELADNAVMSANIRDFQVTTADLADHAVTSAKLADESITAAAIQNRLRNLSLPATVLSFEPTSTIIAPTTLGLRWQSNFANSAFLSLPRPADWDGTSNVVMRLYFQTTTSNSGNVQWFIRPRAFAPGDTFVDTSSQLPDALTTVPVGSLLKIFDQTFTIPATRFGGKPLWMISLQRAATNETYTDDLILSAIELTYTAVQ